MTSTVMLYGSQLARGPGRDATSEHQGLHPVIRNPAIVFAVVVTAALAGIQLQPHGLLSSFWPANAILLGLMLRWPGLATASGWIAAVAGFIAADLMVGSAPLRALLLTAANMSGVIVAFVLFRRVSVDTLNLRTATAPLRLMGITLAGSMAAGCMGMIANPLLFGRDAGEGFLFWTVTEFTNYLAVLPLMLTAPAILRLLASKRTLQFDLLKAAPALACLLGALLAPLAPGPASLVLPVPGLIWCALVYDIAGIAVLTGLVAGWMLAAPSMGWIDLNFPVGTFAELLSLRLGIALILLGPISIGSVMTARNQSLLDAAAARDAAEQAMASRALMLATMTHELRTPLNIIAGYAYLIEEPMRGATPTQQREYGKVIHEASTHMNALVTDLLDTAKVEAGQVVLMLEPTDSKLMIEQSVRLVAGMAMERKIGIRIENGFWPMVDADARAIKQVMLNLLSNAIRFSPDSSVVIVSTRMSVGRLAISVTDKGSGISEDDLKRLGRAYQQAGDAGQQKRGTGLGLALSSDLIRQHGGTLNIDSKAGAGTTVTFDLRLSDELAANDD